MIAPRPRQGHRRSGSHGSLGHGKLVDVPFPTVTSAFYHYAATSPDTLAVRDLSGTPRDLSYQALAERVQQLASQLRAQGVQPGQRIPLVVKRGLEMVVGIWAILSCGAQYVPLDGGVVPDKTINRVLNQAEGSVVLCLKATKHRIAALQPSRPLVIIDEVELCSPVATQGREFMDLATPETGCYVIYTSG